MLVMLVACMLQPSIGIELETAYVDSTGQVSLQDSRGAAIPKIIHFMYKEKLNENSTWPNEIWKRSFLAWRKYFPEPEYKYHFWKDREIIEFFTQRCGSHKALIEDRSTLKFSDYARLCVMQVHGGIYSDLDYEPRINFYEDLMPGRVNLIQSPYPWEQLQNSLMASPSGNFKKFWSKCLDKAEQRMDAPGTPSQVSGPALLEAIPEAWDTDIVHQLPCQDFQHAIGNGGDFSPRPGCELYDPNSEQTGQQVKGIHWGTWSQNGFGSGKDFHDILRTQHIPIFHSGHVPRRSNDHSWDTAQTFALLLASGFIAALTSCIFHLCLERIGKAGN